MDQANIMETVTPCGETTILDTKAFDRHMTRLNGVPQWLLERKRAGWDKFNELSIPRRSDEKWRFTTLKHIQLNGYRTGATDTAADAELLPKNPEDIGACTGAFTFCDDRLIHTCALPESLREKGVIWSSINEAVTAHGDLLENHFLSCTPGLGSDKYQALHDALGSNGSFLYVPPNVEIDLPLIANHISSEDGLAFFPHTLIIAGDNSKVTMVDNFRARAADTRHFVCGAANIFAGTGAQVFYQAVQNWNLNTISFHLNTISAGRDANVRTLMINIGSRYTRNEFHTRIVGPGANVENFSLGVPTGEQEFDQRTLQAHCAPNARSDLLFKNALFDNARTIFSGLIRVEPEAQQTDAYQTNRNLLLSNTSEANSLPGLEILANDVKCSHGATSSPVDKDQIYYLLSRGIPKSKAQELLVFGFFEEILEKIDNEELKDNVRHLIQRKLQG